MVYTVEIWASDRIEPFLSSLFTESLVEELPETLGVPKLYCSSIFIFAASSWVDEAPDRDDSPPR